ncbi:F0F1 ATP synthase subunit delta [Sulfuriflexus mobilis]|uniref:F0F1 ATP synthase subunit delta n=1 Tax=Sulfuriflexus mobilis TaxID=1811807 RepID=UPI000F82DF6D|nr:F0F1 ATP synthase subunit delta [Sulfuriflexus mobilis]
MSELITVARPYAQAAFDLAREAGALQAWSDSLAFAATVAGDEAMAEAIENPNLTVDQRAELFIAVCSDRLDDNGHNFIRLLAENGRLAALPEIAELFEKLRADEEGSIEARVISAKPLNDAQQAEIIAALKKRFEREVILQCETDESLLGGAIIRAGDTVIDGSMRGRLEKFTTALV